MVVDKEFLMDDVTANMSGASVFDRPSIIAYTALRQSPLLLQMEAYALNLD
jgi:hypothetical protein